MLHSKNVLTLFPYAARECSGDEVGLSLHMGPSASATTFDEILPLWQFLGGLFSNLQNFEPNQQRIFVIGQIVIVANAQR